MATVGQGWGLGDGRKVVEMCVCGGGGGGHFYPVVGSNLLCCLLFQER